MADLNQNREQISQETDASFEAFQHLSAEQVRELMKQKEAQELKSQKPGQIVESDEAKPVVDKKISQNAAVSAVEEKLAHPTDPKENLQEMLDVLSGNKKVPENTSSFMKQVLDQAKDYSEKNQN